METFTLNQPPAEASSHTHTAANPTVGLHTWPGVLEDYAGCFSLLTSKSLDEIQIINNMILL